MSSYTLIDVIIKSFRTDGFVFCRSGGPDVCGVGERSGTFLLLV